MKHVIISLALIVLCAIAQAQTTDLIKNGSFETGDFDGWTTVVTGTPFLSWTIGMAGAGAGYSMAPTQPPAGRMDVWNGFDGQGPMTFSMYQDVSIPQCSAITPKLSWQDRLQWNFNLGLAKVSKTYSVSLAHPLGLPVTLYSFSTGTALVLGDSGWQTHSVDVTPLLGMTVRLSFEEAIPEQYTGPGQVEIDAVSLPVVELVSIDKCCSIVPNRVVDDTTLQQMFTAIADECTGSARNHGAFVSCVTKSLNALKGSVISEIEKDSLMGCAAQTSRGKKY